MRKLGFVLPMYADKNGEILSGHQRHLVALRIGAKKVPVSTVPSYSLNVRKAINIGFNRGTNDMRPEDTPADLTRALALTDVNEAARNLQDIDPQDEDKFFPCVHAESVSVKELTKKNKGRWIFYARNAARMLHLKKISMPVVCTRDNVVLNGIGRLHLAAEIKAETVEVVYVTDEQAKLAKAMLNLLSMDFDIHNRYADLLRFNSFRRAIGKRDRLGRAFVFDILDPKNITSKQFPIGDKKNADDWKLHYGSTVCDWGAGLLQDTAKLKNAGIDCIPFEPFYLKPGTSTIDPAGARQLARKFLKRIAEGVEFKTIFMSAVLNSVPFIADRLHIINLLAELANPGAQLHTCAANTKQIGAQVIAGSQYSNQNDQRRLNFPLGYEPRISLADFVGTPKVQKYHTEKEFQELLHNGFEKVRTSQSANNVNAVCWRPKVVSENHLIDAIEFEFNLPYPNGERMNLADEAKEAFFTRRKIIS